MAEQQIINLGIVGIKNMGEYNASTDYEKLNVVTYQGSSYCALQNTKGNLPTNSDYWQLYAEKGDKGDTGDTGDTGPQGPQGDPGNPGGTPLVASSTEGMVDTTKIYVNTTDGKWYYYNGLSWVAGGTYLASGSDDFLYPLSNNSLQNSVVAKLNINSALTGISQGINTTISNIKMKYKKLIPFFIQKGYFSAGSGITRSSPNIRAISDKISLNGTLYIYNVNGVRLDLLEVDPTNQTVHARLNDSYPTNYYNTFNCSSIYDYYLMTANTDLLENITDDDIKKANEGILLFQEPITANEIKYTSRSNLFHTPIDGSYIRSENGVLTTNANMCYCDYIEVKNRERLYISLDYIQGAFYDINKEYISGVNFHPISNTPTDAYIVVDIPDSAYYFRASTRIGNKKDLIISENVIPTLHKNYYIEENVVPKHLVKPTDLINYVNLDLKNHPNDDHIKKQNDTATADGYLLNNGYIKYYKNMKPDKEVMIFIFKTEDSSALISLGSDNSEYGTSIPDSGLRINISVANKTMKALGTNWNGLNTQKQETTFNFDIDNGDDYCCRITKNSIYDVLIELFNANCPDEVCTIHLYTSKDEQAVNVNNLSRMWGCPMFKVDGIATIMKMQMCVSLNQYPKIAVYGDSYAENHSRPWNHSYIRQMEDILGDEISISAGGGDNSTILLSRIKNELSYIHPQYCIIQTGANDYNVGQSSYENNMTAIINILNEFDIIPILITCPPTASNGTSYTWINNFVKNSGYKYIDIYSCLTNSNGTQDLTKFNNDGIHPNKKGADAIMKYIQAYLPELLIK